MSDDRSRLEKNLTDIRTRIALAAERVGRSRESVTLVAVTKYVSIEHARLLVLAGCHDLGESRPQELWRKSEAMRDLQVRWHLVGHLQRNKVRRSLPSIHLLHSADSIRLLQELDSTAESLGKICQTLLEVNVAAEPSKHGLHFAELDELVAGLDQFSHVKVGGLMAMAALERQGESAREDFRRLRRLRDELQARHPHASSLSELSMGMSGDFEIAIEEGATIVRVGSALFEGLTSIV